jgi:hypothetical protein
VQLDYHRGNDECGRLFVLWTGDPRLKLFKHDLEGLNHALRIVATLYEVSKAGEELQDHQLALGANNRAKTVRKQKK